MAKIGERERAMRLQRENGVQAVRTDLTTKERNRLTQLEVVIERGVRTFMEVGAALAEVRDSKLYREKYDTFADYCRDRWAMGKSRAYQLIEASGTAGRLSTMVDISPLRERQVRPVTRLPVEEQPVAWQEAVQMANGGQPTVQQVEEVVARRASSTNGKQPTAEEVAPDPVAEWERAEKEVERLTELVAALQSGEAAKELTAMSGKYAQLEGRLRQEMRTRSEAEKDARYAKAELKKIRAELGVDGNREIIEAIRDLKR